MKRSAISPDLRLMLQLVDESYYGKAWHGPNLRGSLRNITMEEACWRPNKNRHNIWELTLHAAYWKYTVRRRILGEKRGSFPIKGSNWFVRPETKSENVWRTDVALLDEMHQSMRDAVASLSSSDIWKTPAGSKINNATIITGIAQHDVYHAGQIQLLKKLQR
jgi:uncharacterized damage-inducible protein DinB